MSKHILMVDDDERILSGYKRNLRSNYDVTALCLPENALRFLSEHQDIAVIVSDFKMPKMDGIKFLSAARKISPDSARIMLTGFADMQSTIDAVNEGNIFRFLTKPCSNDKLIMAIDAGIRQYELINTERDLLNQTLKGGIKVMVDILSAVNPAAFSRSMRLFELTRKLAIRLKVENLWEVEVAALLSQIGCVTIPSEVLERKYQDKSLTPKESELYMKHPFFGMSFIRNIPRLENIAQAIGAQFECYDLADEGRRAGLHVSARLLKVANDYETYLESGKTSVQAMFQMHRDESWYDPQILAALDAEIAGIERNYVLRTLNLKDFRDNMIFGENIVDRNGIVLITKGSIMNGVLKIKLNNLVELKRVFEPFKMLVPVLPHKES